MSLNLVHYLCFAKWNDKFNRLWEGGELLLPLKVQWVVLVWTWFFWEWKNWLIVKGGFGAGGIFHRHSHVHDLEAVTQICCIFLMEQLVLPSSRRRLANFLLQFFISLIGHETVMVDSSRLSKVFLCFGLQFIDWFERVRTGVVGRLEVGKSFFVLELERGFANKNIAFALGNEMNFQTTKSRQYIHQQ